MGLNVKIDNFSLVVVVLVILLKTSTAFAGINENAASKSEVDSTQFGLKDVLNEKSNDLETQQMSSYIQKLISMQEIQNRKYIEHIEKRLNQVHIPAASVDHCCNNDNSSSIPSIVLTAVSVIVTTLGVVIAVLAFWGIKEARRVVDAKATVLTESLVQTKFENGEFDSLVAEKLEQIALRGMLSGRELEKDQE